MCARASVRLCLTACVNACACSQMIPELDAECMKEAGEQGVALPGGFSVRGLFDELKETLTINTPVLHTADTLRQHGNTHTHLHANTHVASVTQTCTSTHPLLCNHKLSHTHSNTDKHTRSCSKTHKNLLVFSRGVDGCVSQSVGG